MSSTAVFNQKRFWLNSQDYCPCCGAVMLSILRYGTAGFYTTYVCLEGKSSGCPA